MPHPTGRCRHRKIFDFFVVTQHGIDVDIVAPNEVLTIHTVIFHRSNIPSGCVTICKTFILGTVHIQTALYFQAGNDFIACRDRTIGSLFCMFASIDIGKPIGVVVTSHEIGPLLFWPGQFGCSVGDPLFLIVVITVDI